MCNPYDDPAELERAVRAWEQAIDAALRGDPSKLALHLTRGRIPPLLSNKVYRIIISAPWRDRPQGTQKGLSEMEEVAVQRDYLLQHFIAGRPRDVVLDELGRKYRHRAKKAGQDLSRSTIVRALGKNGSLGTRRKLAEVTKSASVRPKKPPKTQ